MSAGAKRIINNGGFTVQSIGSGYIRVYVCVRGGGWEIPDGNGGATCISVGDSARSSNRV